MDRLPLASLPFMAEAQGAPLESLWVTQGGMSPHEAAAMRTRRSVLAPRQEGKATKLIEAIGGIPKAMVGAAAGMVDAAKDYGAELDGTARTLSTDYDPRRVAAGLGAETAMNVVGTPALTGGVPAAALGSGAQRLVRNQMIDNQDVYRQLALDARNEGRGSTVKVYKSYSDMDKARGGAPKGNAMAPHEMRAGWESDKSGAIEDLRRALYPERYPTVYDEPAKSVAELFERQRNPNVFYSNFTDRKTGAGLVGANNISPDDGMMAVHNTRPDRLAKADELGGFAVPSIAVVKPAHGFSSFGDVSLVAAPDFVKPSAKNPVFASDVYSPRFPSLNDEGTKIFRGFTPMGNRRYAPLTLDNLVREMKGNVRGGEGFNYGAGSVRAAVTPQFRSISEMQGARDKLVTREAFEPMKEQTNKELLDLAYEFQPYYKYSGSGFDHANDFASMLAEFPHNLSRLNEHYKDLPPELIDKARGLLRHMRDMPTQYFEAKPQRAVGINEFAGAVVPEKDMSAVAPILERAGIQRIEPYTGGVDSPDRIEALKRFPDLLFSGAADKRVGGATVAANADLDVPLASLPKGIRAYHGSPHDFDRFDLSKIGTGEGAQAYGHGLYFAGNEDVARSYRDALSRDKDRVLETGSTLPPWVANTIASRNPIAIDDMRKTFQGRMDEDLRALADPNTMQPWNIEPRISGYKQILKAIDEYASGSALKPNGRMYEVNINAAPEQFLDWDKPLVSQPASVQSLAREIGIKDIPIENTRGTVGSDVHGRLVGRGGLGVAADALRDRGIPGIKYLDQGSRGAGTGSSNYVVFDDKLIDIIRKYGFAGLGLPGVMAAAQEQPSQ